MTLLVRHRLWRLLLGLTIRAAAGQADRARSPTPLRRGQPGGGRCVPPESNLHHPPMCRGGIVGFSTSVDPAGLGARRGATRRALLADLAQVVAVGFLAARRKRWAMGVTRGHPSLERAASCAWAPGTGCRAPCDGGRERISALRRPQGARRALGSARVSLALTSQALRHVPDVPGLPLGVVGVRPRLTLARQVSHNWYSGRVWDDTRVR